MAAIFDIIMECSFAADDETYLGIGASESIPGSDPMQNPDGTAAVNPDGSQAYNPEV